MLMHSYRCTDTQIHDPESSGQPDQPLSLGLVPISNSLLSSFLHLMQVNVPTMIRLAQKAFILSPISARLCVKKHVGNRGDSNEQTMKEQ